MRKSFVTLLLLAGATAILANLAYAGLDGDVSETPGKLQNAQMAKELRSRVAQTGASALSSDTTYVGYNSAYAGSNYWSIGVGGNEPVAGSNTARQGYWDFDHPVHGDSLQGWWPIKHRYTGTGNLTIVDDLRPWWGLDIGNQCNYVINQGTANKRTFGITGVWHADPGNVAITSQITGTNPVPPTWTTIGTLGAAAKSAWCGLRAHGDLTVQDPVTKNYYNVATLEQVGNNDLGASGTDRKFPGYAGQWDQMLYRDITIPTTGTLSVRFKFRSNMSTAVNLNNITRTGWYDQDPLTVFPGNYVKSSGNATPPIDSFMVYVGRGVEPVAGTDNDWTGSDGLDHDVYDAQRRWFGEVLHAQDGTHHELFTTFGDNVTTPQTVTADLATLDGQGYAGKARLVFRVKTNRGGGSDDEAGGLVSGGYTSGGAGAVVLDDIEVDKGDGFGYQTLGDFEGTNGGIDNDTSVSATDAWKSTGKPPAIFYHLHDLGTLVYQDLCGQPGSLNRICNMWDGVLSGGDHDFSERVGGEYGTPEQERYDGVFSPTINLVTPGGSTMTTADDNDPNEMGISYNMVDVTEDYYIVYDMYTGVFDLFTQGNGWQFTFQSYPAVQTDGVKCWGNFRTTGFQIFNPDKQCFFDWEGAYGNGLIRTANASGYPDSLRIGLRKLQQCYRFGISALCSQTLGAYWDNISLMMVDGSAAPLIAVDIWQLYQDTFPANEDSGLPGLAAFDSCAALVKTGLNNAQQTGNLNRLDIPGDSVAVVADGANVAVHLVFRINPGPGNYVTVGDKSSGLRPTPQVASPITSVDNSFWSTYINNNGDGAFPAAGGANNHGTSGAYATRWNSLAWNAARMDTADFFVHPVAARNFNISPTPGIYVTTYHEDDPHGGHLAPLALMKNICFVNDTAASLQDVTCGRANEPAWPPAWVTSVPNSRTGVPVSNQSDENTKILPDGLFTPGTHVQYFFRREADGTNPVAVVPDTNIVFPQANEGSTDAHRWQQFSVLPDTWKKIPYGGPGLACMLYVDWNDRRGNERVWVSIADSLGATASSKWGAHNGWHAAGGQSLNDPAAFVRDKNEQPGSTWDMFGVKASESLNTGAGSIGARLAHRESSPAARAYGKDAKNAPTLAMLEAYYRILLITTGDLNSTLFGPINDKSSDDEGMIESWLLGATSVAHRGIWLIGDGAVESLDGDPWLNNFSVSLFSNSYLLASGNTDACTDLVTHNPITPDVDIYGVRNGCLFTDDVLNVEAGGVAAAEYGNVGGGPYISTVFHDAVTPNYWQSLVDGYDIENLKSRFCDNTLGRLSYFYNAFTNIYAKIWAIVGDPLVTLDAPGNDNGKLFVDSISLANNPLRTGNLKIDLSFAKSERASVRVFDVSGRLIRTLADGQLFKAGPHSITWDAVDNGGRQVARGVYFVRVSGGLDKTAKAVVVK